MSKVIVVAGYGPGISHAVATKFGKDHGYTVALLSRTQSKLDTAAADFKAQGVKAQGIAVDLSQPEAVQKALAQVKKLGEVHIIFWNPYGVSKGVLDSSINDMVSSFNLTVTSLQVAIQEFAKDLEKNKGAILVTGGGLSLENDGAAQLAVDWNASTLAVPKAAQRKFVHVAHFALKPKGIFVGEVTVLGAVKDTPFDFGKTSKLTAQAIADKFESVFKSRAEVFSSIS